jgi:hypothetical protein
MSIKAICAGIGTLALIGGLAACGSAGSSAGSSSGSGASSGRGGGNSPYAQGFAYILPGDNAAILGIPVLDDLLSNAPYELSTQPGEQWALGLEVYYEQHILVGDPTRVSGVTVTSTVVNPSTLTVSGDGITFQAVLTFSDGSSGTMTVADPLTGWSNGQYGASWTPITATATDPAGNTCSSLDSAGYCPGDDPATHAPATQAPATQTAPAPVSSAPAVASVRPAFGCYVNENEQVDGRPVGEQLYGATIDIQPGTGTGYSTATVKVTFFDKNGNVLGTDTVTATSSVDQNEPWQTDIYPDGGPASLATESSCTATVESAS